MASTRTEWHGDVLTIWIEEAHVQDEVIVKSVDCEIADELRRGVASKVLLHLGHVEFIASSFLFIVVRWAKQCKNSRIALKLCSMSPAVREMFKTTRLDTLFEIYPTEKDALRAFRGDEPPSDAAAIW